MSNIPNELKYVKTHEWIKIDDEIATIGVTDHAQSLLGDIVFVDPPEIGQAIDINAECAVVESVKSASDIYSPLTGEVTEINDLLADTPELINQDPYGAGWIYKVKISNTNELSQLLDASAYQQVIDSEAH